MTQPLNVRRSADREHLLNVGFMWVTVVPRGDNKGQVRSKHRTYAAAERAARGIDRAILEICEAGSY